MTDYHESHFQKIFCKYSEIFLLTIKMYLLKWTFYYMIYLDNWYFRMKLGRIGIFPIHSLLKHQR
jgi:hypothetical protein